MGNNTFGKLFKINTWGESHGKAIGVVIDGCPAGLSITEEEIRAELALRAPGQLPNTSQRKEPDLAEILSGVFEGKTTGAPISIIIPNRDADSSHYEPIKNVLRPGHANHTFLEKYGIFDYRGGGRASARETACRVAAGAIAKKLLATQNIHIFAHLQQVAGLTAISDNLMARVATAEAEGDSVGGAVEFTITGLPAGLGDPVYERLDANLAKAMLSIPASKAFELGSGFRCLEMQGSEHNDPFTHHNGKTTTETNHAGGTLGGISTGMPLNGRVAFKPTSSICKPQATVDQMGSPTTLTLPQGSRHDPCVAIRAVPVVAAMAALVVVDAWLLNRIARI